MNHLRFWLISGLVLLCIGCGTNSEKKPLAAPDIPPSPYLGQPQPQTPPDVRERDIRQAVEQEKREEYEKRISEIQLEITALEDEKKFMLEQVEYVKPGAQRGDFNLLNKESGWFDPLTPTTPRTDKEVVERMQREPANWAVKGALMDQYPEWTPAARAWKNRYKQWKWLEARVTSLTDKIGNLKGELAWKQAELRGLKSSVIRTETGSFIAPVEERGGNGGGGSD